VTDNCKTANNNIQKPNRQACVAGRFYKHINIHTCSACSWIQRLTGLCKNILYSWDWGSECR